MRSTMRQLLSRKSNPRMSQRENENSKPTSFSIPREPGDAERNTPSRNVRTTPDMLGLFPPVSSAGPVSTHSTSPRCRKLIIQLIRSSSQLHAAIWAKFLEVLEAEGAQIPLKVTNNARFRRGLNTSRLHRTHISQELSRVLFLRRRRPHTVVARMNRSIYREPFKLLGLCWVYSTAPIRNSKSELQVRTVAQSWDMDPNNYLLCRRFLIFSRMICETKWCHASTTY